MVFSVIPFWILIPFFILIGWLLATFFPITKKKTKKTIYPDYFKGINLALNDQADKAIDTFIRVLEVNSDTVESHLALGGLFRRRGEIARAICIHQNLIARPTLSKEQHALALLELGNDHIYSGLLDRAEELFLELANSGLYSEQAYIRLLDIYQQEKDWVKAIEVALNLVSISGKSYGVMVAQFYCELAEIWLNKGDVRIAKENISKAIRFDSSCVRAVLIKAKMFQDIGKHKLAIRLYKKIESQDSSYITETLQPLYNSYSKLGKLVDFIDYLKKLLSRHKVINVLLMLSELIAEYESNDEAIDFIMKEIGKYPTVKNLDQLIKYMLLGTEVEMHKYLPAIKNLTAKLVEKEFIYKCNSCGFDAKSLYWQCPSCKNWNSVKSKLGIISA